MKKPARCILMRRADLMTLSLKRGKLAFQFGILFFQPVGALFSRRAVFLAALCITASIVLVHK